MPIEIIDRLYELVDRQGTLICLAYVRHRSEQVTEEDIDKIVPQ